MIGTWPGKSFAEPTKLIFAVYASHVITTLIFLNFSSTDRAKWDSPLYISPSIKFIVHIFLASNQTMPFISALKAQFCQALRTNNFLNVDIFSLHGSITSRFATPPHQWISFSYLFVDKVFELLQCLWLYTFEQILKLFLSYFVATFVLEANKIINFCPFNLHSNIFTRTIYAETMTALKTPCKEVIITDWLRCGDNFIGIADRAIKCLFIINFFNLFIFEAELFTQLSY